LLTTANAANTNYLGLREWFRWYKSPDLKPLNRFGFEEVMLPKKEALAVIEETHHYWKDLRSGKTDKANLWVKP
jgi:inorganic pyrophosphatase